MEIASSYAKSDDKRVYLMTFVLTILHFRTVWCKTEVFGACSWCRAIFDARTMRFVHFLTIYSIEYGWKAVSLIVIPK